VPVVRKPQRKRGSATGCTTGISRRRPAAWAIPPEPVWRSLSKDEAGGAENWPQKPLETRLLVLGRSVFRRGTVLLVILRAVLILVLRENPGVDDVGHLGEQR